MGKDDPWKKAFEQDVLGKIVMTRYNKMTYRVDDVNWNMTPLDTFKRKGIPVIPLMS